MNARGRSRGLIGLWEGKKSRARVKEEVGEV